jgi:phosphate:Na+ symporter
VSKNIENIAGKQLRKLFNKTSKNKLFGVGIGALSTAAIQSSSATTVMIVGFVNSGIMTLTQATALIMGANIGTTITALIMSFGGTSLKIFFIAFVGIGGLMILLFEKKEIIKKWGYVIAGLGMMFLGMDLMSVYMTYFFENSEVAKNVIANMTNPFLLLLLGVVLTSLVQSSAAVTILVMSLSSIIASNEANNYLLFVILGSNIGTCVTALLSSIGANNNAKRVSLIHLLFNFLGSFIFFFILLFYKNFTRDILASFLPTQEAQIAFFHFIFNLSCTLIFLPFSSLFVSLSKLIIKDKKDDKEISLLDERLLNNGSIALGQVKKEMLRMSDIAFEALSLSLNDFLLLKNNHKEEILGKIEEANQINKNIVDYIVKIPSTSLNTNLDIKSQEYYHDLADLQRIGEIADNVIKHTQICLNQDLVFSSQVKEEISHMFSKVKAMYQNMSLFLINREEEYYQNVVQLEDEVDNLRSLMIEEHNKRLDAGLCKPESSGVFINLIGNLERVGDHINFVTTRYYENINNHKI